MLRFIIRRVVVIVPMLFIIVSITWGLVRLAPGNFYLGERKLAPAVEKNLRERYGMDKPWYVQYWKVFRNFGHGDLGTSLKYEGQSVNQIIWRAFPVSATLGLCAYLLALAVGITTGTLAALRQNSWIDYACTALGFSEQEHCPAGDHAFGDLHCLHRAFDAFRNARGHALRLHSHCAR